MKIICELCKKEISKKNIKRHQESSQCIIQSKKLNCKFCGILKKNNNSLINHERYCTLNPTRAFTPFQDLNVQQNKKKSNQFIHAKELGLPPPIISLETREKLKKGGKNQIWDEERKIKHSIAVKKAVLENPDSYSASNVCGRVKIEEYNGEKFHGKWEVEVATWFDKNNIKWERKIIPIKYMWNDKYHLYFPDFYLPEYDLYVEVKGYETERDKCKWMSINNIIILKYREIQMIRKTEVNDILDFNNKK